MPKHITIVGIAVFFTFALFSLGFCEESMTITTYYPSPYGSYNELTTTGNTYLATSSGNVGIGTTDPWFPLHVRRDNSPARILIQGRSIDGVNPASELDLLDLNTNSYWNLVNEQRINTGTAASDFFIWHSPGGVGWYPRFVINDQGNVGIGTATPGYKLDVNLGQNDIRVIGDGTLASGIQLTNTDVSTRNWYIGAHGNGSLYGPAKGFFIRDMTGAATRIVIDTSGNVGIGTTNPQDAQLVIDGTNPALTNVAGLTVIAPGSAGGSISLTSPSGYPGIIGISNSNRRRDIRFDNTGISLLTNSAIGTPNGTNGIIIDESGSVGIGTATPGAGAKLDVNGDIAKQGTIIYGVVAGGQCLNGRSSVWDPRSYLYGGATCSNYTGGYDGGFASFNCPAGTTRWITFSMTNNGSGGEGGICIK